MAPQKKSPRKSTTVKLKDLKRKSVEYLLPPALRVGKLSVAKARVTPFRLSR